MDSISDTLYMRRALDLARLAEGYVAPNPLVGAVVVWQGRIIGEGYHHRAGAPHAEVNAFNSVRESDREKIPESTLYVTLEPCCHTGKTPPCCDRIIAEGVKRVVVAMKDPYPAVAGRGIERLRAHGIRVEVGLLEAEAEYLNRIFLTMVRKHRPFVTLKWAESLDGFIDKVRYSSSELPVRFSSDLRLRSTHRLRHIHDGILIGANTLRLDNPSLTNRFWYGKSPVRVVLDGTNSLLSGDWRHFRLLRETGSPVLWISDATPPDDLPRHVRVIPFSRRSGSLFTLLCRLLNEGITSLLVEGGATVLQSFIDEGIYDQIEREVSPLILKQGLKAPIPDQKGYLSETTP